MFIKNGVAWTVLLLFPLSCSHLMNRGAEEDRAKLYLQASVDHFGQKEYGKSLEAAQQALERDPNFAPAYNQLALVYMETKRHQKSEEAFKKALEIQPDYPEVHNNLGALMNRLERYGEAVQYFENALASERYSTPENAQTNLGYSYLKMGQLTRAKTHHQKALDLAPTFCLAHKNMGDTYVKERNTAKANEYFQNAVTHCPLYAEAQYKLALNLVRQGQKKVAKNHLEKLIERHKNGPYVERSTEVLKYLR